MSARKLQQEVERTFKRVAEGITQFESIYEKLNQCTNASQKEKLEDSLKREIKKLQRQRDQIKTWAASSEIKDKKPLLDERKKIEMVRIIEPPMSSPILSSSLGSDGDEEASGGEEGLKMCPLFSPCRSSDFSVCYDFFTLLLLLSQERTSWLASWFLFYISRGDVASLFLSLSSMIPHICPLCNSFLNDMLFVGSRLMSSPHHRGHVHILQQMEKFKAVEKEMKTKAYSKEGLMASTRLDPMAQKKADLVNFLSDCTTELDRQIEACEAEAESLTVTLKKSKKSDTSKADRVAEVEKQVERHKWHQGKLELIMRLLENGQLDAEQVERVKEDIKFYVDSNQDVDFQDYDNDQIYDELDLDEENAEDLYGIGADVDRMSSQDTQSIQDDLSEKPGSTKDSVVGGRRPSTQLKSPMPALATLHQAPITANTIISNNGFPPSNGSSMKPAPLPARPAGEVLKYASVATAAAAADRNVGIAPLPPPPGMAPLPSPLHAPTGPSGMAPLPPPTASKHSSHRPGPASTPSATSPAPLVSIPHTPSLDNSTTVPPSPKPASAISVSREPSSQPSEPSPEEAAPSSIATSDHSDVGSEADLNSEDPSSEPPVEPHTNGASSSSSAAQVDLTSPPVEESIYHLPPGLQDLMSSFENTKKRLVPQSGQVHRYLEYSLLNAPDTIDAEKPRHYKPTTKYDTARHYPQEPLPIFDDPLLYKRVDVDTLFYVFYYKQGTYQQYLAAKELKKQSWRFHKQYQTWFQRHEEPKTITEEYEQGTYRFFDYESTWMNRRKTDFKFAYKYLEDDVL